MISNILYATNHISGTKSVIDSQKLDVVVWRGSLKNGGKKGERFERTESSILVESENCPHPHHHKSQRSETTTTEQQGKVGSRRKSNIILAARGSHSMALLVDACSYEATDSELPFSVYFLQ